MDVGGRGGGRWLGQQLGRWVERSVEMIGNVVVVMVMVIVHAGETAMTHAIGFRTPVDHVCGSGVGVV